MDLEVQEYIKDILLNYAKITTAEIEENVRQHSPCQLRVENIVPNMEQAIFQADWKILDKRQKFIEEMEKSQWPIGQDLPK